MILNNHDINIQNEITCKQNYIDCYERNLSEPTATPFQLPAVPKSLSEALPYSKNL